MSELKIGLHIAAERTQKGKKAFNKKNIIHSTSYKSNNYENPEDECTVKLNANKVKQHLENTLLSQGITESQAKLITSGVLGMDEHNLKMADVMAEQGMQEAAKQMFVHPTEARKMSYAEMRSFYG